MGKSWKMTRINLMSETIYLNNTSFFFFLSASTLKYNFPFFCIFIFLRFKNLPRVFILESYMRLFFMIGLLACCSPSYCPPWRTEKLLVQKLCETVIPSIAETHNIIFLLIVKSRGLFFLCKGSSSIIDGIILSQLQFRSIRGCNSTS